MKLIRALDEKMKNKIDISNQIKKIPYFFLYFQPIKMYKEVKLSQMNEELLNFSNQTTHVLIEKEVLPHDDGFISFFDSMNHKSTRETWMHLFYSYSYLLKSLHILQQHGIVYFNLSNAKIGFNKKAQPILFDFSESFLLVSGSASNANIKKYQPTIYTLPMEYHIISFLNEEGREKKSISRANLEEIAKDFIIKNQALRGLPEEDIKAFYQSCVLSFPIINDPREVIVEKMRAYSQTWDNYGLSAMFLPIVKKELSRYPGNKFWHSFSQLLLLNISPDPSKRLPPLKTLELFEELLSHAHYQDSS
jgi:hypothetical protein